MHVSNPGKKAVSVSRCDRMGTGLIEENILEVCCA